MEEENTFAIISIQENDAKNRSRPYICQHQKMNTFDRNIKKGKKTNLPLVPIAGDLIPMGGQKTDAEKKKHK